jgi:hypothetical protein
MQTPNTPTTTDIKYYYIKPKLNIPNIFLVAIIIAFFCFLIFKWNYTSVNWENEKCNNSNFFLAPLYGKDAAETIKQCTADVVEKSVKDSLDTMNLTSKMSDLNTKFDAITKDFNNIGNNATAAASNTINNSANIIQKIQQNIDNVKTSLTKVLGSVILTTYMNDGVLQSTQNLQNTDLVNIVNKYNDFNNVASAEMSNPMPSL